MPSFRLAYRPSRRPHLLIAFAVALAGAGATRADDFGLSVAGGTANGRVDCLDGFPCDHRSGYLKLAAAYRGIDPLEFQLAYFHVGNLKGADTAPLGTRFGGTFKISGIAATAGYRWAFAPDLDLVARAGVAGVRARFAYDPPFSGEPVKTTLQPFGSLGVGYAIGPTVRIGIDYDATRLKAHATRGVLQLFGVSAQFTF